MGIKTVVGNFFDDREIRLTAGLISEGAGVFMRLKLHLVLAVSRFFQRLA
jgi:hypothetical protein